MKLYSVMRVLLILGILGFADIANANWNCDINFVLSFGEYGSAEDQFVAPAGIAVNNGYIYVNDSNNHCFKKFDLNGNFLLKWYPEGITPGGHTEGRDLAADNEGNIYTVNSLLDDIQKFDSNGNFILKWGEYGNGNDQFDYANGIAIDKNNNIYVADAWQNRVQKFDSNGNFIAKWGSYGSKQGEFDNPRGLACSNGYIYVTDNDNHRIQKFDLEGNFIMMWGTEGQGNGEFSRPLGITIDSDEHIFVTDDGRVQIFDTNGNFLAKFGTFGSNEGELSHAAYIDVDNEGNVYIVDQDNNRVQKFNYNIEKLSSQIIFEDNFDDGIIDDSKWYLSCGGKNCVDGQPGESVEESGGILRIAADATDNRGVIISHPITIDPSRLITIERRIKVHYSNNYCKQSLSILDQNENYILTVGYFNYHYNTDKCWFGLSSDEYFDPIWDEWFDEKLTYDPSTGETTYSLNNETPVSYIYEPLEENYIKLEFNSNGWWTGHETQVDYVKVSQESSSQYQPSITVKIPSSNIDVTQGKTFSVSWIGENITSVGISRDEDNTWGNNNHTLLVEQNLDSTGSTSISTSDWPVGTYYICVWAQDDSQNDGYVYDFSNATITIKDVVDASSLNNKIICGYQGWFGCEGDGSPIDKYNTTHDNWLHWSVNDKPAPGFGNQQFELYPDITEYPESALFQTGYSEFGNGQPAKLFSSYSDGVIELHFKWMKQYSIDGVALQRFGTAAYRNPEWEHTWSADRQDDIAKKVKNAAESYGRVFYIMYDISGMDEQYSLQNNKIDFVDIIKKDWSEYVSGSLNLINSQQYLNQNGKPIVGIWGIGFNDDNGKYPGTAEQYLDLIKWFKNQGCYVIGGVPYDWRDADKNKIDFQDVYNELDMISPWSVGRFPEDAEVKEDMKKKLIDEAKYCSDHGIDYLPVVYPGFAWSNWHEGDPQNEISRRKGDFFWQQAYNVATSGIDNIYVAMFDEFDEGTAIAKAAEDYSMIPTDQYFLTLSADGTFISSDFYLRLTEKAGMMIKGFETPNIEIPIPYSKGPVFFRSSVEINYDAMPNWTDTVDNDAGGIKNISGFDNSAFSECGIVKNEQAHFGKHAIRFSGKDTSDTSSFAYFKVFDVDIPVNKNTTLKFWTYPQQDLARYVTVDLVMKDGTTLRDSGAVDTNGKSMHPNTGRGSINTWTETECNIGNWLNGNEIDKILICYDSAPFTGDFRGYIDDITIETNDEHYDLKAPELKLTKNDLTISLEWNKISNADGYTLFYAPYPNASYINNIDMKTQTNLSLNLWGGAAFYVGVQAYNSTGNSDYSNIMNFITYNDEWVYSTLLDYAENVKKGLNSNDLSLIMNSVSKNYLNYGSNYSCIEELNKLNLEKGFYEGTEYVIHDYEYNENNGNLLALINRTESFIWNPYEGTQEVRKYTEDRHLIFEDGEWKVEGNQKNYFGPEYVDSAFGYFLYHEDEMDYYSDYPDAFDFDLESIKNGDIIELKRFKADGTYIDNFICEVDDEYSPDCYSMSYRLIWIFETKLPIESDQMYVEILVNGKIIYHHQDHLAQ